MMTKIPTAVHFGAGNIGRGFLGQLYFESNLATVFVDVDTDMVDALNARGSYLLRIVGTKTEDILIRNVRAVHGGSQNEVVEALSHCLIASTAVGANALKHIAPVIAAGVVRRMEIDAPPLNIIICENLAGAGEHLRSLVCGHLTSEQVHYLSVNVGFVQAVVSRMVPIPTAEQRAADLLEVRAEAYKRLPVDAAVVVGELPKIVGFEPVAHFAAHEARKLYTHNCAHAALGYLGFEYGIEYGYDALTDARVRPVLESALSECGQALVRKYGFEDQAAHVAQLLERFENKDLGDTCFRLARDPIRKLAPQDRLVGAARLCESQGSKTAPLARVIASALRFSSSADPSSLQLQTRIAADGLEAVLADVCGIAEDEPLHSEIKDLYLSTTVESP